MKRFAMIVALLLAAAACFAQKRVYLHKPEFSDGVYVIKDNSGEYITFFQLDQPSVYDTLYIVAGEKELPALRAYFTELKETFKRWSRTAKSNHVKDFRKPFEIEPPTIRMRWVEPRKKSNPFIPVVNFDEHFTNADKWLRPDFRVNQNGACLISVKSCLYDTGGNAYDVNLFLDVRDIEIIIRYADHEAAKRTYDKKAPKMSPQEIRELFK